MEQPEQVTETQISTLEKLVEETDWGTLGKQIANSYQSALSVHIQELKAAVEQVATALNAMKSPDQRLQETFTNWKEFLDMEPTRLQSLHVERVPDIHHGFAEIEKVPPPSNTYAKQHKPGAIYQSGTNEWYVESGTTADNAGGSGYLVTRQYVPERSEFRWFCTCIAAKRAMYTDNPYCKHMYAVTRHLRFEPVMQWTTYTRMPDVAFYLHSYKQNIGLTEQEEDYIEDLKQLFPQLAIDLSVFS